MPRYLFECTKCARQQEEYQSFDHCGTPSNCKVCGALALKVFSANFSIHADHDHYRLEVQHMFGADDTERLQQARIDSAAFEEEMNSYGEVRKPQKIDWEARITEMENTPMERVYQMIDENNKRVEDAEKRDIYLQAKQEAEIVESMDRVKHEVAKV